MEKIYVKFGKAAITLISKACPLIWEKINEFKCSKYGINCKLFRNKFTNDYAATTEETKKILKEKEKQKNDN